VGGHVNTVVMLCRGLSKLGWEIHIVTTPSRFFRDAKFDFPGAKMHLIKPKGRHNSIRYATEFFTKAVNTVVNLNRNAHFDLVHAHAGYFSVAAIPVAIKKRLGVPALFSLYCPASLLPRRLPVDKYGTKVLSTGLDKVVAVSNNVKNSLLKFGVSEEKIEVIPPCFNEEVFNPLAASTRPHKGVKAASSGNHMILFVGNVDQTKGFDVFLKAAEIILREYPRMKFVATLHEPYEAIERVKASVSRRFSSAVTVLGVVEDMAGLMASADVVVAPFRSTEGIADIPLVVLEAMALGKSVVASKVGGVEEAIRTGENGVLIDANRADELANAIIGLFRDSNLKELSERAALSVKQFSCTEVSKKLNDLYVRVIKGCE